MKKEMKKVCKVLSVFLTVLFVIEILPLQVMAAEFTDVVEQKQFIEDLVNNPTDVENADSAEILYEVEEKRDEFTKVYKKTDGSYTAIVSKEPLHYLDNGVWEEIDNSLSSDGNTFTNASNIFNAIFPKSLDDNAQISIENGESEIAFSVNNISGSNGVVENAIGKSDTQIDAVDNAIVNTQSSITYEDVEADTDIQYIVTPNSIKENVIVSDKNSVKDSYSFTIEKGNLTCVLADDGSVSFINSKNEVEFSIPRPIMTDATLAFSYDIDVNVVDNNDGTIELIYSPSKEWTSSNDRVYPINIDPAIVVVSKYVDWIEDNCVIDDSTNETDQDKNFINDYIGFVANVKETNSDGVTNTLKAEIYTKINPESFKNLGENIVFTDVQYILAGNGYGGKIIAKEVSESYNMETITHKDKPDHGDEVYDYYTTLYKNESDADANSEGFVFVHFNITKAFNDWLNGETNNGFVMVPEKEGTVGMFITDGVYSYTNPSTGNTTTTKYETNLIIDYIDLGGYNEKLNYHIQYAGRAGTGYVNDFTQSLSVIRDDIYIGGDPLSVTIGMTYNSATYNKLDSLNYTNMMAYGNKWIPTYLRAYLYNDENYLTYYTDTGSTIDFVRSTDSFGNVIFTESYSDIYGTHGYEIEYYPASDGNKAYYTVSRPDGYIERFDSNGLLISITNPDITGQTIFITYDSMFRIDCIMDYGGNKYKYTYNDRNLLSKIEIYVYWSTEKPIAETCYIYDGNNNLISVTSYDGELIEYEYDEYGNITSMTHKNNFRIKYEYDANGRVVKVTEQDYDGTNYVDGNIILYERLSSTQIKIKDENDDYKIYQFNNKGNLLYTTDNIQPDQSTITNENNCIINGDFRNELEGWTIKNYDILPSTISQNGFNALELPAEVDVDCTVSQTITIDGKKNDTIAVAGWLKGDFTKSSTNNVWLRNLIEESEDPKICNFTNDRYAQIEVSYQYNETNQNGVEETLSETIVVPFAENLDEWQYVSRAFTLKGDCETVTVLVRYSNNANSALLSNIELIQNGGYKLNYKGNSKQLESMSLGLRDVISYTYNEDGTINSVLYNDNAYQKTKLEYKYNNGKITEITKNDKKMYRIVYDGNAKSQIISADNRIIRYIDDVTGLSSFTNSHFYSIKNEIGNPIETFDGKEYKTQLYDVDYNISNSKSIEESEVIVENNKAIGINSTQDWYGRRSSNIVEDKNNLVKIESQYGYDENAGFETLNQVTTYTNAIYGVTQTNDNLSQNYSFSYEYDENGNIIKEYDYISENSMELRYSYEYDEENQLVRYNDNISNPNRSYSFEYDSDGNLVSKSTYTYTPLETELGEPISTEYYNAIPTSLDDATLTWNEQQLESYERTDDNTNITTRVEYSYDENGLMTEKKVYIDNVLNETYNYTWAYGKLNNLIYTNEITSTKHTIKYVYDSFNSVQGFILNHTETYLYLKNLYGDIIGVVDSSGSVVLSYEYDVWGVPIITCNDAESTLSNIIETLPLTYRGCCYDYNTGLYYVENRYYNPQIGKFINANGAENNGLTESNPAYSLFTYWENHPTMYIGGDEHEIYRVNSIANYLYNKELSNELANDLEKTDGFIINQTKGIVSHLRYGFSTTGPSGCGWVATYNALKMLGVSMEPHDIIREYEMSSGLMMYGFSGTNPLPIAQFFIKRDYNVNITFNTMNYDYMASTNKTNILNYSHSEGGHYVALNGEISNYSIYNLSSNSTGIDVLKRTLKDFVLNRDYSILISIS